MLRCALQINVEYTSTAHYLLRKGWLGAMAENAPSTSAQALQATSRLPGQDAHSARMGNSVLHFHPAPQSQCQPSAGTSVPSATPVPAFGWHLSAQRHAGARFFFLLQVITDLFLHTITCHTGAHSHAQRQPAHSLGAREKAPLPPGYLCAEAFLRAMPLVKVYLHNCLLTWWT